MRILLLALGLLVPALASAFDINGVRLGGREIDVKKAFPSAHCKALEWKTDAADRRCDDAQVSLGGVAAKITVFFKADVVQAYDLSFDMKDLDRVKAHLRTRWGAPLAEATEVFVSKDAKERKVFKMRWEQGADRAILTAQMEKKKRATLEVSRGNFEDAIYRIK
ncbi:MAG TPA: hypothetical protein VMU46_06265 [Burkholderiales bacterium]|nr:hypothetical protein [Burkholderiales bacterium]